MHKFGLEVESIFLVCGRFNSLIYKHVFLSLPVSLVSLAVNKHKPWIETSYHGVITENMDTVLLDPPLVALDKDAPVPYAGAV